ncbi:hypothetical protein [Leucothrix pacifica]|uniref:WAP domain-containing protein n=1 Tax=Leucothrix pacifica TaxID=1247513 RepID=A0A317C3N1_9GAMM|nr:hypothetical protein [Leucothrix pacifica]PWQ92907.1 hypothetical protein DKW60_18740 [Leucothrix pacifica]
MKQYSLILLMFLSLTTNAVAGFTVPQFIEHGADSAMLENHAGNSHHNKSPENNNSEAHVCHDDTECNESEDCCTELCQIAYAVLLEQAQNSCLKRLKTKGEYIVDELAYLGLF